MGRKSRVELTVISSHPFKIGGKWQQDASEIFGIEKERRTQRLQQGYIARTVNTDRWNTKHFIV